MAGKYKIMLVAGEASGDAHAAKLASALRRTEPDAEFEFFGSAGVRMREAGVEPVVRADDLAIMGIPEIAAALPRFLNVFKTLKAAAVERRPDVVVLVDFPEFNLKLAKSLKKLGLKIVYYISPQLWAWRGYRKRTIRDHVDLLLTILPFEKDWYAGHGITNVEYVGNPLVKEVRPSTTREEFRQEHGFDDRRPLIALLPGSRGKEIERILPPMARTAAILSRNGTADQFVVALASTRRRSEVESVISSAAADGHEIAGKLLIVENETYNALHASDAAAVASGTATLETGIIGTPMAIVYKTSGLNFRLVRPLISVEHFGLINLIAGKRVAAEMIQDAFTPTALARELARLLQPGENAAARRDLAAAAAKIDLLPEEGNAEGVDSPRAAERAAAEVKKLLN